MNLGYSISTPRGINMDTCDLTLLKAVMEWEPTLKGCIDCGTCTATCTAQPFSGFNFRRLMRSLRAGEYNDVRRELPKCMLCGKCRMACPRGVNTRNAIVAISQTVLNKRPL